MEIMPTELIGASVIRLAPHRDHRGFFMETWRDEWTAKLKCFAPFVQDNHARSEIKGVLRGLHFQTPPYAQAKLVWVSRGAVFDVAVDLRAGSPTFGRCHGVVLSEENMLRFFIPEGFAHGYMTLEPGTEVQYKVSAYYAPAAEDGIRYDDPDLAIPWPALSPVVSDKDMSLPSMKALRSPFSYRKKQ